MKTPKHKDWRPGEHRIEAKVVRPDGSSWEFYVPGLEPEEGRRLFQALMAASASKRMPR